MRDGAGGGFNERQGRVSAANVEITADGFDDFGRRAKGRAEDKKAKEAAALARLQSNYGFLLNPESMAEFVNANKANESSAAHAAPDKRPEGKKRSRSRSRSRDRRNHERSRGDGRDRNEDRYRDGGDARDRHSGADRRRDFDYDKGKAGHHHRQHGGDHDRRR